MVDSLNPNSLNCEPPETLFHYTTASGALGILESRSVWATSIHYLNDLQEFQEAKHIAEVHFRRVARESTHSEADAVAKALAESLERIARLNVCVFSLSEIGNLLSQWRAYCPEGGYSLGFDSRELRQVAERQGANLVPCVYSPADQLQLMAPIVERSFEHCIAELHRSPGPLKDVKERVVPTLHRAVAQVAPAIKNEAFAEEREWRIVSPPTPNTDLRFRVVGSLLVPYSVLSLDKSPGTPVVLNSAVAGPSPQAELSFRAFGALLSRADYPWRGYEPSHIPFRDLG